MLFLVVSVQFNSDFASVYILDIVRLQKPRIAFKLVQRLHVERLFVWYFCTLSFELLHCVVCGITGTDSSKSSVNPKEKVFQGAYSLMYLPGYSVFFKVIFLHGPLKGGLLYKFCVSVLESSPITTLMYFPYHESYFSFRDFWMFQLNFKYLACTRIVGFIFPG